MFTKDYADVFAGDERWQSLPTPTGDTFAWDPDSTYVRKPPYFEGMAAEPAPVDRHRRAPGCWPSWATRSPPTTSPPPARSRPTPRPGSTSTEHGVDRKDFNSYGSRRGNHEVMIRGTFANIRLRNQLARRTSRAASPATSPPRRRAGVHLRRRAELRRGRASRWSSWPARSTARARRATGRPRAPRCSACKAVIAESYERIHRSNLIGMGVLPLQFPAGETAESLGLDGDRDLRHHRRHRAQRRHDPAHRAGDRDRRTARRSSSTRVVRIDTPGEADYYRHGGILQYVLRGMLRS